MCVKMKFLWLFILLGPIEIKSENHHSHNSIHHYENDFQHDYYNPSISSQSLQLANNGLENSFQGVWDKFSERQDNILDTIIQTTILMGLGVLVNVYVAIMRAYLLELEDNSVEAKVTIVSDSGDTNGITGEITFAQEDKDSPIRISGTVRNLPAGGHGFHVHEKKHTGTDCSTAGGHFNPENTSHGSLTAKIRHAGDFGSIYADASGVATFDFETGSSGSSTLFGDNALYDKSVVIHASPDDFGQPTGNAGGRLACGVLLKS